MTATAWIRVALGVVGLAVLVEIVVHIGVGTIVETLRPALVWLPLIGVLEVPRIASETASSWLALGTLAPRVRQTVEPGSTVYTDALKSYYGLAADYDHAVIDHLESYVNGRIHTNGVENFWSLLKRGLHGTYVSVDPGHLFRYLDERVFTYNLRDLTDFERFATVLRRVAGRRLTYAEVTGQR